MFADEFCIGPPGTTLVDYFGSESLTRDRGMDYLGIHVLFLIRLIVLIFLLPTKPLSAKPPKNATPVGYVVA